MFDVLAVKEYDTLHKVQVMLACSSDPIKCAGFDLEAL